jgi:hypothetical protein
MKKVVLFFVVALAFASCKKAEQAAPAADSVAVTDSTVKADTAAVVDTAKVDTAVKK